MPPSRGVSAIDDDSAEGRAMSTHELRQRMHHDIRAIFDWSQQNRRCPRSMAAGSVNTTG